MKFPYLIIVLFLSTVAFAQSNDTITTASGLKYFITKPGNGKVIDSGSIVIQHYTVWLSNGTKLDSSRDINEPFVTEYPSKGLIKGFVESISVMKVGDRGTFIMPYYLAYGEKGIDSEIPPKETLTFDIEILDTKKSSVQKEVLAILYNESYKSDSIPKTKNALAKYQVLKEGGFKDLYESERNLNSIGYRLLEKYPNDALAFFKQIVIEYPKSWNAYDSLGEGYMTLGETRLAIDNYKKSLEMNPDNSNAVEKLKELRAK